MTDRARRWWTWAALLAIVVGAAALRLAAVAHGRPYVYHPDEWVIEKAAMWMIDTGSILPPWYYYPSLLVELLVPVTSVVHALTGASLATEPPWGLWGMRQLGWNEVFTDQFRYFLAGRWVVAVLGIATVPIVFVIGRRIAGAVAGLTAAAILGGCVLHVLHSTFLTTDVPLAFLGALVFWASLRLLDDRRWRWLIVASVATGLAASTKYNGASLVVLPALAWFMGRPAAGPDRVPLRWAIPVAGVAGALAVLIGTPALVLDPNAVAGGIRLQVDAYAVSGLIGNMSEGPRVLANLAYYADYLWRTGLGPAVMILIAVGIVRAIRRRSGPDLLLIAFPAVYLLIASVPLLRFERNLIVMLPFLAVLGGMGAVSLGEVLSEQFARLRPGPPWRAVALTGVVLVTALVTAPLLATAVGASRVVDTRTIALEWVASHLRGEARIVRERYTPQVAQATAPTDFAVDLIAHPVDWYRAKGYGYIIASDYSYGRYFAGDYPAQQAGYEAIFALPEVYRVAAGEGTSGPTIRIFRLDP